MTSNPVELKVILVGESFSGKTCIFELLNTHEVCNHASPTISPICKEVHITIASPHTTVRLLLFDTAGTERFQAVMQQFYRNADIALLVYSVTDARSFERIENWRKDVLDYSLNNDIKMILIGNKIDLTEERCIPKRNGSKYANEKNMKFIEMSARNPNDFQLLYDVVKEAASEVMAEGGSHKSRQGGVGLTIKEEEEEHIYEEIDNVKNVKNERKLTRHKCIRCSN